MQCSTFTNDAALRKSFIKEKYRRSFRPLLFYQVGSYGLCNKNGNISTRKHRTPQTYKNFQSIVHAYCEICQIAICFSLFSLNLETRNGLNCMILFICVKEIWYNFVHCNLKNIFKRDYFFSSSLFFSPTDIWMKRCQFYEHWENEPRMCCFHRRFWCTKGT